MRRVLLFLCVAGLGCEATDGVAPMLEPGGYRLSVHERLYDERDPGVRFELAPDGTFIGHARPTRFECGGTLTPGETVALTDALNEAQVLRVSGAEVAYQMVVFHVEGVAGAAAGFRNDFIYQPGADAKLDAILPLTIDPVIALQAAGECTACPTDEFEQVCYPGLGTPATCTAGTVHTCAPENQGEMLSCLYATSVGALGSIATCDGTLGWVPAMRWTVAEASLRRWFDDRADLHRALLTLSLAVESGEASLLLSYRDHMRLEDGEGNLIELPERGVSGSASDDGIVTLDVRSEVPLTTLQAATSLRVRLRERPFETTPFAPPVDVTILDEAP